MPGEREKERERERDREREREIGARRVGFLQLSPDEMKFGGYIFRQEVFRKLKFY